MSIVTRYSFGFDGLARPSHPSFALPVDLKPFPAQIQEVLGGIMMPTR
jgi:hypothetical protein